MKLIELLPEKDGQIFLGGKKGSGKSSLVRNIMKQIGDNEITIVLDSKHEWNLKRGQKLGNKSVRRLRMVAGHPIIRGPGIYVYQSKYPHFYDSNVTIILLWAYKHKNVTVVIHEIYHFCHGNNPLPALGQAIAMGRSKNMRLLMEAQRPTNIPQICLTEANIYVMLHLSNEDDRIKIAKLAEAPEMLTRIPHGHDFWVAKDTWENAVYIENEQADPKAWDSMLKR